jgi:hypothetical protein
MIERIIKPSLPGEEMKWVFSINFNNIVTFFETELEAWQMSQKLETAREIIRVAKSLATVADLGADVTQEYFDSSAFTDDDVAPLGITAAQLTSVITMLQELEKFFSNEAVTAALYRTTLNGIRRTGT